MGPKVTLYFDPVCPFAWIAAQWLRDVAVQAPLELTYGVMSLAILNESPDDPFEEARGLDSAWRPVRVAMALADQRGEGAFGSYFQDFGRRFHVDRVRGRDRALRETLAGLGAESIYPAADDHRWDEAVRQSHQIAIADLEDVGTPIIHLDGEPMFGPVLTSVPRGRDAVRIFDAVRTLTEQSVFAEMKGRPIRDFDPS